MNNEEKILEILEQHSELLTTIRTDVADLKTDVADLKERMVRVEVTQENMVLPQLQLLAEGQSEIKDQIRSLSVIDRMQDDIFVLKAAVRQLSSELEDLKKAQ